MKCIACGREMLDRGTHYKCSNILCDYEEEIEEREKWARLKRDFLQNPPAIRHLSEEIVWLFVGA